MGWEGLALTFKMLTNPESLMQHNPENCFGIFVEICRNIIPGLKALLSKTPHKSITLSDPVMVVKCVLIRCLEMGLQMIFLGNIEFLFLLRLS